MTLTIDLQLLKRGWERQYLKELHFVVRADFGTYEPSLETLEMQSTEIQRGLSSGNPVNAEQWLKSTTGWSAVLTDVERIDDALEWLEAFAARWAIGEGSIIGGPTSRGNPFGFLAYEPTAFVAYTTGDQRSVPMSKRGQHWFVETKTTRFVAEKIQAFAYTRGCRQYLNRFDGWDVELDGLDWTHALAQAIERFPAVQVSCVHRKPDRTRNAVLIGDGQCLYQVVDPSLSLEERIAEMRGTLTWTPPHTDLALIRTEQGNTPVWDARAQPWPHVSEPDVRYNRPLLASMVPDVNGIQLLTAAHLERANDLSGWTVTKLAGPRYLVEAKDVHPWYAERYVDEQLLDQARANFGDMIMTKDAIEANSPWT